MPSSVVWAGITRGFTASAFTLAGNPLPFLTVAPGGFTSIYDFFVNGLLTLDQHPDAAIPVEAINGPVMLMCGEQDRLWPSCPMSRQVEAWLKDKDFRFDVQLLASEDAGHYGFGPPLPSDSASFVNAGGLGGLGGSAAGNAAAQWDSWPRAIAFLDAAPRAPAR